MSAGNPPSVTGGLKLATTVPIVRYGARVQDAPGSAQWGDKGVTENPMKINPSVGGLDESKATGNAPARPGSNGTAGPAAAAAGDTIHLSALSAQLSALGQSLAAGSEFDRAKVEAIKEAIRDGRLTVNADVVAERMLATALAMLRKDA